jgi:hypothetical protein
MTQNVINALNDVKRHIEVDLWTVPTNDAGSGSAGVNFLRDNQASIDTIDAYIRFAETGDNTDCPNTESIDYVSISDFGEIETNALDEIMQHADNFVEREDVLGFVVCHEHYDMDYTLFITHIRD